MSEKMTKIIILGVGNAGTLNLYNTCFDIQNENGDFLVDTGGSIELINRLNKINVDYKSIRHIFISHSHSDHILGFFWFFIKINKYIMQGDIKEKINVYCNDVVYESIKVFFKHILQSNMDAFSFKILNDGDKHIINEIEYTFFDIKARGTKQYGFKCVLNNRNVVFLGDETLSPELYDQIRNSDYVMHEVFCLDSEENIFHAYEKNHSTVKSVSEVMNKLNVKNLILFHTEETHGADRKRLYTDEAKLYFNGKAIVPDELETIDID